MASRCLNQPTTPPAIPLTRSLIKLKYHIVTLSPAPRSSQTLLYFRTTCSPLSLSLSLFIPIAHPPRETREIVYATGNFAEEPRGSSMAEYTVAEKSGWGVLISA